MTTIARKGSNLWSFVGNRLKSNCSAVISNGKECAAVGTHLLAEGGSAIDAAIATLLCEGVVLPYCMGIGGGFVATIYTRSTGKIETLIARESAPLAAHQLMFLGCKSLQGPLACAVPGEILGYWELHQKFGKLPWKQLFAPAIKLAKEGHHVSPYVANALKLKEAEIRRETSMDCLFVKNNRLLEAGDHIKYEKLGETLQAIAEGGAQVMYGGGEVGRLFAQDVQEMGGILTEADLLNYRVRWRNPICSQFGDKYTFYSAPLPTSGVLCAFILNVMNQFDTKDKELYMHGLVEAFKHAFAQRTKLGDHEKDPQMANDIKSVHDMLLSTQFAKTIRATIDDQATVQNMAYYGAEFIQVNDSGTANVAALESNGNAITITSTINSKFAAKVRSCRTGILLNDEMDDFATPGIINTFGVPASPANYIYPGKLPLSSMCPSIILDSNKNVRLLVGAAGGTNIITSVVLTILRYLVLNQPLKDAVNHGRFHHQLVPPLLDMEYNVPVGLYKYLAQKGHNINVFAEGMAASAITCIGVDDENPQPVTDHRRVGSISCIRDKTP